MKEYQEKCEFWQRILEKIRILSKIFWKKMQVLSKYSTEKTQISSNGFVNRQILPKVLRNRKRDFSEKTAEKKFRQNIAEKRKQFYKRPWKSANFIEGLQIS